MTSTRFGPLAALVTSAVLVLGACSDGGEAERTPEEVLTSAKTALDETSGVHVVLATERLPAGVDGILRADGVGTHDPAFEGDLDVATGGVTADVAVVAVQGEVHAKLPFTTKFVKIDPADYQAPDPSSLMRTEGGLSSLLTAADDVGEGDQVRSGDKVLTEYTGSVPGDLVAEIIPSASPGSTFDATFTIDDQDRLARATLTGPFYPEVNDVTYTITFDKYGTAKDIRVP
jgi:lipoprotein LprG